MILISGPVSIQSTIPASSHWQPSLAAVLALKPRSSLSTLRLPYQLHASVGTRCQNRLFAHGCSRQGVEFFPVCACANLTSTSWFVMLRITRPLQQLQYKGPLNSEQNRSLQLSRRLRSFPLCHVLCQASRCRPFGYVRSRGSASVLSRALRRSPRPPRRGPPVAAASPCLRAGRGGHEPDKR
jgi:hypothetical protein